MVGLLKSQNMSDKTRDYNCKDENTFSLVHKYMAEVIPNKIIRTINQNKTDCSAHDPILETGNLKNYTSLTVNNDMISYLVEIQGSVED